jgi:hypothetical protein
MVSPLCSGFAALATAWLVIVDFLQKSYHYSFNAASFRASMAVSTVSMVIIFDRPFTGFWYRSGLFGAWLCKFLLL